MKSEDVPDGLAQRPEEGIIVDLGVPEEKASDFDRDLMAWHFLVSGIIRPHLTWMLTHVMLL
jgi:hypothetical protein